MDYRVIDQIEEMEPEDLARIAVAVVERIGEIGGDARLAIEAQPKGDEINWNEGLEQLADLHTGPY